MTSCLCDRPRTPKVQISAKVGSQRKILASIVVLTTGMLVVIPERLASIRAIVLLCLRSALC